jgi:2-dehydropantoate 2-reductase
MTPAMPPGPVLVMGAGAIGCYLGGCLQAAGVHVTLVGRPRVLDALRQRGLTLTDLQGERRHLPAGTLALAETLPPQATPTLVLLCVKSSATASAAAQLQAGLPSGTVVLSMQNGLSNARAAQAAAPALRVLPGMVPFNVAELAPAHFHRGTDGVLAAQDHAALRAWQPWFARAGLPLALHADLTAVQWGKLLLNLNNPVNALSGLPLRAQLLDGGYRRVLAALIEEALAVLHDAGLRPARLTPLPPAWLPGLLRLPTPLFRLLAARMLRIDDKARSSMADDLARGRPTEIDALCGEVVRLAAAQGRAAPLNAAMVELVKRWPEDPHPRPAASLMAALGMAPPSTESHPP